MEPNNPNPASLVSPQKCVILYVSKIFRQNDSDGKLCSQLLSILGAKLVKIEDISTGIAGDVNHSREAWYLDNFDPSLFVHESSTISIELIKFIHKLNPPLYINMKIEEIDFYLKFSRRDTGTRQISEVRVRGYKNVDGISIENRNSHFCDSPNIINLKI